MKPLISVIVPIYNVEKYVEKCILSLMNQTYSNLEIILVDDGSTDTSGIICDKYKIKKNVNVIHKMNGGLSDARNKGIAAAKGEYIGFVDGDDYVEKNMYEKLMTAILLDDTEIACCGMFRESDTGENCEEVRCVSKKTVYTDTKAINEILLNRELDVSVCNKLFKSDIFDKIIFPVGKTNEDASVIMQIIEGNRVVHVGEALYHYIYRDGSITSNYNIDTMYCMYINSVNIYDFIKEKHPLLIQSAEYFLSLNLMTIICAYLSQEKIIYSNMKIYLEKMNSIASIAMHNPYHSKKNKVILIMIKLHLIKLFYKARKILKFRK